MNIEFVEYAVFRCPPLIVYPDLDLDLKFEKKNISERQEAPISYPTLKKNQDLENIININHANHGIFYQAILHGQGCVVRPFHPSPLRVFAL